jgi:hypothetical protein
MIMAWTQREDRIVCLGFPKSILSIILKSIDEGNVAWIADEFRQTNDVLMGRFTWSDCDWEVKEQHGRIFSISLVEGKLDNADLTALILRG